MDTSRLDEVSRPLGTADQSRREALKKFGRYAAAAPTAMVLLQSRDGFARQRRRRRGRGDSPY